MQIIAPDGSPVISEQEFSRRKEEEDQLHVRSWHEKVKRSGIVGISGEWFDVVMAKGDFVLLGHREPAEKSWEEKKANG